MSSVSARPGELGHCLASRNLSAVERVERAPGQLFRHADEGVTLPDTNIVDLIQLEALVLQDALKVAGLGTVLASHIDEDFARGKRTRSLLLALRHVRRGPLRT